MDDLLYQAISYHAVTHDAVGYLYAKQNKLGPGYRYYEPNTNSIGDIYRHISKDDSPLAGQISGVKFWLPIVSSLNGGQMAQNGFGGGGGISW